MYVFRTRSIKISLFWLFAACQWSVAEPFICPGGQYAPTQKAGIPDHDDDFIRWGKRDSSNNFLPHTVITYSFVEAPFAEDEENNIRVNPIFDNTGNFPANARKLIQNAFDSWSIIADITFQMVTEPEAIGQIRVGTHDFENDLVLGHGFFPPSDGISGQGISGDLHLNSQENWRGQEGQMLLFAVALHEIGHTIGLDHIIDTNDIEDIIMFAIISNDAGPLTIFDQAYAQTLYGPPIPKITSETNDAGQQVNWTYPYNPFCFDANCTVSFDFKTIDPQSAGPPESPRNRVPRYDLEFIRCPTAECGVDPNNAANDIVILETPTIQDLSGFEMQSVPATRVTLSDDVESSQNALFNTSIGDSPDDIVSWEIGPDREPETDNAYQITVDEGIPEFNSLILRQPITTTSTSEWRFQRSFALSIDQRIDYRILDVDGTLLAEFSELGDDIFNPSRPLSVAYQSPPIRTVPNQLPQFVEFNNSEFIVDLNDFSGHEILIEYVLKRDRFFENAEAIFIDNIIFTDVLSDDFSTISSSIDAEESFFLLGIVPAGEYRLRMRALYTNSLADSVFSRIVLRTLQEGGVDFTAVFTPDNTNMEPITLAFGRNTVATFNNDDPDLDLGLPNSEDAVFYLTNRQSQSGPEKLLNDYRPLTDLTRWRIRFEPTDDNSSGQLTWNSETANLDYFLFLQELDGELPVGMPIDLRNTDPIETPIPISRASSFEILYGIPQEMNALQLKSGWNLVSVPLVSLQSVADIFSGIKTGSVWAWDGIQFQITSDNDPLSPEKGYWINSIFGGSAGSISGLPSDGLIHLRAQWNLVGPVVDFIPIPQEIATILEWNSEMQRFQRPAESMLMNTKGYWIFSKMNASVQLGE